MIEPHLRPRTRFAPCVVGLLVVLFAGCTAQTVAQTLRDEDLGGVNFPPLLVDEEASTVVLDGIACGGGESCIANAQAARAMLATALTEKFGSPQVGQAAVPARFHATLKLAAKPNGWIAVSPPLLFFTFFFPYLAPGKTVECDLSLVLEVGDRYYRASGAGAKWDTMMPFTGSPLYTNAVGLALADALRQLGKQGATAGGRP